MSLPKQSIYRLKVWMDNLEYFQEIVHRELQLHKIATLEQGHFRIVTQEERQPEGAGLDL